MVVPVPVVLQKEQVKTLSPDVFKHIDELSAPRLVEYWEQDPCEQPVEYKSKGMRSGPMPAAPRMSTRRESEDLGVTIEAKFEVGEYQVLILSAKESGGLEKWLKINKYNIPKGAASSGTASKSRSSCRMRRARSRLWLEKHHTPATLSACGNNPSSMWRSSQPGSTVHAAASCSSVSQLLSIRLPLRISSSRMAQSLPSWRGSKASSRAMVS